MDKPLIKKIMLLLIVLAVVPIISAACPPSFPDGAICDESGVQIILQESGPICSSDGTAWLNWSSGVPEVLYYTIGGFGGSIGDCYNPDASLITNCCPVGSVCSSSVCQDSNIQYCSDYTDKDDCNNYTGWVGVQSVETLLGKTDFCGKVIGSSWQQGGETCANITGCGCEWIDGVCDTLAVTQTWCNGTAIPTTNGECIFNIQQIDDNCNTTGRMKVIWSADGTLDFGVGGILESDCQPRDNTFLCEDVLKLGFFNWVNLIIAVIIISGIYIWIKKR